MGAATLATGFGLVLSIAPAASACASHTPWGPWNGLGYEQQTVASGLPFHLHHCHPLAEQSPQVDTVAPAEAPLVETRPLWRPAVRPAAEHALRHRAHRHHGRHHRRRHGRHHGHRFHNSRLQGVRYHLGGTVYRTAGHRAVTATAVTRVASARALGAQHSFAHHFGHHHGRCHHHRHHHRHHHLRHHRHLYQG